MSSTGNGPSGPQGNPPWGQPGQYNMSASGNVYATQKGNITIGGAAGGWRGPRVDSKVLLATLLADGIFFLYGMLSYTGRNTGPDQWRAGIFLFLLLTTFAMAGRWIRRRI